MFFNFFSRKWWASPRKGKEIWKKEALYLRKAVDRLAKAAKASGRLQARPHARRRASVDEGIIEIFGSSYGSLVTWEPLKICRNISIDRFVLVGLGGFGVSWEGLGRRETDFGQTLSDTFFFFWGGVGNPSRTPRIWEKFLHATASHDLTIETADGCVTAHAQMLQEASPVVQAMLGAPMREQKTQHIQLPDSWVCFRSFCFPTRWTPLECIDGSRHHLGIVLLLFVHWPEVAKPRTPTAVQWPSSWKHSTPAPRRVIHTTRQHWQP